MRIRYVGHGSFSLKYNKQVCVSCNHVTQLQLELVAEARGCDLCPSPSAVTEVRAVRAAEFRCVIFPFADTLHRYKQTLSERASVHVSDGDANGNFTDFCLIFHQ